VGFAMTRIEFYVTGFQSQKNILLTLKQLNKIKGVAK